MICPESRLVSLIKKESNEMKLTSYKASATKRVLITGISGAGKSTLAAEMAEHGYNLIWLNLENAADGLLKLSSEAQDRVELINIPDSASYPIAAATLLVLFKNGRANICDTHGKDGCPICAKTPGAAITPVDFSKLTDKDIVVVDSGTQLSYSIMSYVTKDMPVEAKMERDNWGSLRKYTEFFKSQFQGFRGNLIITCQCMEAEMEDGRMLLVPSFGSAAMSASFASAFDAVIFAEIKNGKHRAFSKSTASPKVLTRSRGDFEIEKEEKLSLVNLFNGTAKVSNPMTANSPGVVAAKSLTGLAARIAAGK